MVCESKLQQLRSRAVQKEEPHFTFSSPKETTDFSVLAESVIYPESPKKMRDKLICLIQSKTITLTGDSFLQYKNYRFSQPSDPNRHYCVSFNDILGLEESKGVHVDDLILALKGHVKDGYEVRSPRI